MKNICRSSLKLWARTGFAPAILHQVIDRYGLNFANKPLPTRLLNRYTIDVDLRDHVQRRMYYFGAYEIIDTHLLGKLTKPGMTFVDAGANIGQYTLMAADRVGSSGQVHAFEPVDRNFQQLKDNLDRNNLSKTVRLNQKALWHEPTTLSFTLPADLGDNQGSYTAVNKDEQQTNISCPAITLDQYAKDNGIDRIDIMKMDIEGSELNALKGGREIIAKSKPIILLEINLEASTPFGYTQAEIQEYLDALGYKYWRIADSVEHSHPVEDLCSIDRANILCHTSPLPPGITSGWSLKKLMRSRGQQG